MVMAELHWSSEMHLGQRLTRYKAWANERLLRHLATLPEAETTKPRQTYFGSILHTLQHNYIVDDIFRAHLEDREHGYTARRKEAVPVLDEFRNQVLLLDRWWIAQADKMGVAELHEDVSFEFIGGGPGRMAKLEIIIHLTNHTSYHRGFVDEILGQLGADGPPCDLSVYLREMCIPSP